MKQDAGKLPLHLIDPLWLESTAAVLDYGQKKYAPWNWAAGTFDWSRLYGALQRHLNAWWGGEELDAETGLPHLWHANCCMMFLTRYTAEKWGQDDRFKFTPKGDVHPHGVRDIQKALDLSLERAGVAHLTKRPVGLYEAATGIPLPATPEPEWDGKGTAPWDKIDKRTGKPLPDPMVPRRTLSEIADAEAARQRALREAEVPDTDKD
jgi:hypothetical protein